MFNQKVTLPVRLRVAHPALNRGLYFFPVKVGYNLFVFFQFGRHIPYEPKRSHSSTGRILAQRALLVVFTIRATDSRIRLLWSPIKTVERPAFAFEFAFRSTVVLLVQ